jgi:hypothetical protein
MTTTKEAQALLGQPVVMTFGPAVRWGTLRSIEGDTLIIDGYHDSAGIGAYIPGRGCTVTEGVPVTLADMTDLRRAR